MSGIVWAIERLETARPAIEFLLPRQWEETGEPQFKVKPNWDFYAGLEAHGALLVIVLREEGRPIGYISAMMHPHVNATGVKMASIATYYVEPRATRAVLLRSLWRACRQAAASHGCVKAVIDSRPDNPANDLLELLGGVPEKIGYAFDLTKEFSDA